jgi:hypothetical protein
MSYLNGSLTRGTVLRVPRDLHPGADSQAETIALSGPTEGQLVLDDSGRRSAIRALGDPIRYECSFTLLPGWKPDEHWDVDQDDDSAMDQAVRFSQTDDWSDLYAREGVDARSVVGRYWVLNEHGGFRAKDTEGNRLYQRETGPWKKEEDWDPFDFKKLIPDLAVRGDDGWSTRRRRFLRPVSYWPESSHQLGYVPQIIEVSFDGGGEFRPQSLALDIDPDCCAVRIALDDLREIIDSTGTEDPAGGTRNLVTAYIRGQLRIRVSAVIEGDDQMRATARDPYWPLPAWSYVNRRQQLRRVVREFDANALYSVYHLEGWSPDDRAELAALAQRTLDEASVRRAPGHVSIPYILAAVDDWAPWDTYRVGDEVFAIRTDDGWQDVELSTSGPEGRRGPRVAGITYHWSSDPPEASTQLIIEDRGFEIDVPGAEEPDPAEHGVQAPLSRPAPAAQRQGAARR